MKSPCAVGVSSELPSEHDAIRISVTIFVALKPRWTENQPLSFLTVRFLQQTSQTE